MSSIVGKNLRGKTVKFTFADLSGMSIDDTQVFFIDSSNRVEISNTGSAEYPNYYYDLVYFGGEYMGVDSGTLDEIEYTFPDDADYIVTKHNEDIVSLEGDLEDPIIATVTYNGETIANLLAGQKATLKCQGDNVKMLSDIEVQASNVQNGTKEDLKAVLTEQAELIKILQETLANKASGGGAKPNIAFGDAEPSDKTMLWVKTSEPEVVTVGGVLSGGSETLNTNIGVLPTAARCISCASVGTKIYLFGGSANGGELLDTINVFDTVTKNLTTLSTKLPAPSMYIGCASVGNKIYLFGGYGKGNYDTINMFDAETNTIETLSTTLPSPTAYIACVSVGTKIYLFGGYTDGYINTINMFDTETNTIGQVATLPVPSYNIGCASVGTKIYLFGGYGSSYLNTINVFDTETNTLTSLSTQLPTNAELIGVGSVGTKIYLFGGQGSSILNTINVFDTETNTIETLSTTLPSNTYAIACTSVGINLYLFGGSSSGGARYSTIHQFVIAFSLEDGKLLITNGTHQWKMVNSDTFQAEIGIKEVYLGNTEGIAEKVPSALYQDDAWVEI